MPDPYVSPESRHTLEYKLWYNIDMSNDTGAPPHTRKDGCTMVAAEIIGGITVAVFSYVAEQSGLASQALQALKLDSTQRAYERALGKAAEKFEGTNPHLPCGVSSRASNPAFVRPSSFTCSIAT